MLEINSHPLLKYEIFRNRKITWGIYIRDPKNSFFFILEISTTHFVLFGEKRISKFSKIKKKL